MHIANSVRSILGCVSPCSSCRNYSSRFHRCVDWQSAASWSCTAAAGSKSAVIGDAAFAVFKMAVPMQEYYFLTFCNIFMISALSTVPFLRFIIGLSNYLRDSHSEWYATLATCSMQPLQSACWWKEGGLCTNARPLPWTATLPESRGSWPQDIPPPCSPLPCNLFSMYSP